MAGKRVVLAQVITLFGSPDSYNYLAIVIRVEPEIIRLFSFIIKHMPAPKDSEAEKLWRERMSSARRKLWQDPEYVALQSRSRRGIPKSEEHKAKIAAAHIGIGHSKETRALLAQISTGKFPSEETRAKMGKSQLLAWERLSAEEQLIRMDRLKPKSPTRLEIAVENVLKQFELEYETQFPVPPYRVDFFVVKFNLVLEADGEYWHQDKEYEARRDAHILAQGYGLVHIPERDIREDCAGAVARALEITGSSYLSR
jgi:very-short-patch-repair endonuclease